MHISHHTAAQAFDLSGTRMLITGAAGGIGSATARLCNQLGATLVLSDFGQQAKLEELARGLLARLQFRGEDAPFKKVGVLSGGERTRVALAKFLLHPANFYILDEPTNHLDPLAREVLIEALIKFQGTILMSTHDNFLIDRVATGIFDVADGKFNMVLDPQIARIKDIEI